jgi:hypothetical protein
MKAEDHGLMWPQPPVRNGREHRVTCICGSGSAQCSGDFECCYRDPPESSSQDGGSPG